MTPKVKDGCNIMVEYNLKVFKQNTQDCETDTNSNYKVVMKDVIIHLFPPKALYHHKIYLHRVM